MALIQFDFFSETLRLSSSIKVVFSQRIKMQKGADHKSPVLYLLHGLSDDHSTWTRRTSIERYVEDYDVIVVMPAVHRSFYRNTHAGHRYYDYVAHELPEICAQHFSISQDPAKTFVAGLSMGGYGAFKLALSNPQAFAAAASLSGVLDIVGVAGEREERLPDWPSIFGPDAEIKGTEDDLLHLASQLKESNAPIPQLFQCCGTEDYLYLANQSFRAHAAKIGLQVKYEEGPGAHEWGYWDQTIQRVLDWLPLPRLENEAIAGAPTR
ncbi:alpha/beta hydrolase family protein [Pelagicoccus sp. SDUM812005]|uniref:alpha/beta hydrolase n=1 Tax=Pelagicoccus sp. SDUM812005 TaxID=3041257 RepID=UPI00280FCF97|nr:alpha/beta hydrolase family protein [Pelagicoccus sp. SDUM812005]MDQ8179469.1 alpha/beta hydrolase family protein [Pelagicoccus sp. SDUM812005]